MTLKAGTKLQYLELQALVGYGYDEFAKSGKPLTKLFNY